MYYKIENVLIEPLIIFAHSFDEASEIFKRGLLRGFGNMPDATFEVTQWKIKPKHRAVAPWSWSVQGKKGVLMRVDQGQSWELVGIGDQHDCY